MHRCLADSSRAVLSCSVAAGMLRIFHSRNVISGSLYELASSSFAPAPMHGGAIEATRRRRPPGQPSPRRPRPRSREPSAVSSMPAVRSDMARTAVPLLSQAAHAHKWLIEADLIIIGMLSNTTRTLRMILDSLKSGTVCMPVPSTSQTSACQHTNGMSCRGVIMRQRLTIVASPNNRGLVSHAWQSGSLS